MYIPSTSTFKMPSFYYTGKYSYLMQLQPKDHFTPAAAARAKRARRRTGFLILTTFLLVWMLYRMGNNNGSGWSLWPNNNSNAHSTVDSNPKNAVASASNAAKASIILKNKALQAEEKQQKRRNAQEKQTSLHLRKSK